MTPNNSSSRFTQSEEMPAVGPPLMGALLRMAYDTVRSEMLASLHAKGFDDLDTPHLNVLQYPGPDGMRPSDLAARLRVSKQALNYLLGELERMGYLEREPDPDDQRSRRIVLTERGRAIIPVIRDAVRSTERTWAQEIGEDRLEQLRGILLEVNALDARAAS
jgi:DNA-binding MarR family transcriptional regulator